MTATRSFLAVASLALATAGCRVSVEVAPVSVMRHEIVIDRRTPPTATQPVPPHTHVAQPRPCNDDVPIIIRTR